MKSNNNTTEIYNIMLSCELTVQCHSIAKVIMMYKMIFTEASLVLM